MAIEKNRYTNEYQKPTEQAPKYDRSMLRHRFDLHVFSGLGIDVGTSERGRDAAGTLRFYELNAQGELKDPFADGSTLQSDGFLDKIAQGRIIAFPSGEKKPVQMQVDSGSGLSFSKPMEEVPIPKPQEPARLGGVGAVCQLDHPRSGV